MNRCRNKIDINKYKITWSLVSPIKNNWMFKKNIFADKHIRAFILNSYIARRWPCRSVRSPHTLWPVCGGHVVFVCATCAMPRSTHRIYDIAAFVLGTRSAQMSSTQIVVARVALTHRIHVYFTYGHISGLRRLSRTWFILFERAHLQ